MAFRWPDLLGLLGWIKDVEAKGEF